MTRLPISSQIQTAITDPEKAIEGGDIDIAKTASGVTECLQTWPSAHHHLETQGSRRKAGRGRMACDCMSMFARATGL